MTGDLLPPHAAILPAGLVYEWNSPVPVTPIFDAPAMSGLGPIARRLAFELAGRLPAGKAGRDGAVTVTVTLRGLYGAIWPHDARPWRRTRKGRDTAAWLLGEVAALNIPLGNGARPLCAAPDLSDHTGAPDLPLAVTVAYPAWDTGGGARIDLRPLRRIPLHAQPLYEAMIRLAYVWDRYPSRATRPRLARKGGRDGPLIDDAGHVIRTRRGKAVTGNHVKHPRAVWLGDYEPNPAIERAPWFGPDEWARMVYGVRPPEALAVTPRRLRDHARRVLARLVDSGLVVAESNGRRRNLWAVRVLRPGAENVQLEGSNVQPEGSNVQPEGSKHSQAADNSEDSNASQTPSIPEGCTGGREGDATAGADDRNPSGIDTMRRPPLAVAVVPDLAERMTGRLDLAAEIRAERKARGQPPLTGPEMTAAVDARIDLAARVSARAIAI